MECGPETSESSTPAGPEQSRRGSVDWPLERTLWNPWDAGSGAYPARRIGRVHPDDELGCGGAVAHGATGHTGCPGGVALRLCVFAGLLPVLLAVGATSSILEMTPPIGGLSLANLRDMFGEVHNGHPHEAIDILEPRGTPEI